MRIIGLIGGMSWASTAHYYRRLNELVAERRGGLHSAQILLRSVDFAPIAAMQAAGEWDRAGEALALEAQRLQAAGAEIILLATNTMHLVASQIEAAISVPFIHIADATAAAVAGAGFRRPGLIATAFTMERRFYTDRLSAAGLTPLVPPAAERADVHRIIFDELCRDVIRDCSRKIFETVARGLAHAGADCLILGCTEVGMLLNAGNVPIAVFDTVDVHCQAAVKAALKDTGEEDV